jgi:VWFA-related protein
LAVVGAIVAGSNSSGLAGSPSTPRISLASLRASAVQPRTRTVCVSATDKNGSAVRDLQADEFQVKAGGKTLEIVSVRPATSPLRIALIVADAGTGAFQLGLAHFMQNLLGHAEFALISVIVQPETVIDYSTDAGKLSAALDRLGRRGVQRGAQLMEAIQDATKDVRRETKRPVIVVMRIGGEATSAMTGNDVREQLRKSGAILYVISTLGAQRPAPSQITGTDAVSVQQGQLRDAELADAANNLAQVLGDGSKDSGGRHDEVVSTTLVTSLERVADELLHQYEITYALPDGVKPGDKLSVSSKRKGVTVHAPARLP